jgi:phosphate transport system substrate-binding protein
MRRFARLLAAAVCVALTGASAGARAEEVHGGGSTFAYPIIWKWAQSFRPIAGHIVGYEGVGSSRGVTRLKDGVVDFAASDKPLRPEELQKFGLGQFPLVVGGIVPVVNVEGVAPGRLKLTGPILAEIYMGKIKTWSDPAVKSLNPDLSLPNATIAVVHRLDGSGTTFNWTSFLAKASPAWLQTLGAGSSIEWPLGTGAKGNEGVALAVQQIPNSIGYVEHSFAIQLKLSHARVQNQAGQFLEPDARSLQAAMASTKWDSAKDFYAVIGDSPAADAYPIAATTFALLYKQPKSAARSKAALEFFRWALTDGREDATALGYAPLPDSLVRQIEAYWTRTFGS